MIGVTLGMGSKRWEETAQMAAIHMQEMTGLDCFAVTEPAKHSVHPSWQKCFVHEMFPLEDSFFIFDCDIVALKPWNPEKIFEDLGRPFIAVPEDRTQFIYDECTVLGIGFPGIYVNGGFTIFGREHKHVWEGVWKRHPKCGKWYEQGALNLVLLETETEVCRLPRWFNVVCCKGKLNGCDEPMFDRIINLHGSGLKEADKVIEFRQRYENHHLLLRGSEPLAGFASPQMSVC